MGNILWDDSNESCEMNELILIKSWVNKVVKQVKTKIFFNYKTKHDLPFLIAKALKKRKRKKIV